MADQMAFRANDIKNYIEILFDPVIVMSQSGTVTIANGQALALFGYYLQEMIDQPLDNLLPERFRAQHTRHRKHYFAQPSARPMGADLQLFGLKRDGSEFPLDVSLRPILIEEKLHVLAVIRDQTMRSEMQKGIVTIQTLMKEFTSMSSLTIQTEALNKLIDSQLVPLSNRITSVEGAIVVLPEIITRIEEVEKSMKEFTDQWKEIKPTFDRIDNFFKWAKRATYFIGGIAATQFVVWLVSQFLPHAK